MQRSSPCGDVNWNPQFGMIPNINNGSSPCGDVSWNTKTLTADQAKETWVEIYVFAVYFISSFSSSPCGDVSWNHKVFRVLHNLHRSSPYGDVSWNTKTLTADQAKERSSPYGDVNWNRASSCACMSRNTIRLLVGMWVEICWRYIWTRYQNVRLRKETWVEISDQCNDPSKY